MLHTVPMDDWDVEGEAPDEVRPVVRRIMLLFAMLQSFTLAMSASVP